MNRLIARLGAAGLVVMASGAAAYAQQALGTAFTYQGVLDQSGSPVNATADFQFSLFDAATAGNLVAGPVSVNNVNVADGLFTVSIDFGATAFNGQACWLSIAVRSPAGGGAFTILSTRQKLTAAPYALKVPGIDGFSLDAADGSPTDALFVDNAGNVGIGTATPAQKLSVAGTIQSTTGGFMFPNGTVQTTAATGGAGFWSSSGTNIFNNNTGNVGIGTMTPGGRVDIQASDNSNVLFGRRTGGGLAHNLFIDGAGNGSMQLLDSSATPRINLGSGNTTYFNYGNVGIGTTDPYFRLTTVANFPSDGVGVIGSSPNSPSFSLGASGYGTSYLGMATDNFNFSGDAAPGDLILLSEANQKLLLQNGFAGSAVAIVGGNVGIGTTTPANKLTVAGNANFTGNVGIGTTTPGCKLDARSSSTLCVCGQSDSANGIGVYGVASAAIDTGIGVFGYTASPTGYGVYSIGDFGGSGGKYFRIDHPFDPANKYLNHQCAEGPEPLLIYRGNVTLDGAAEARVDLPDYFEAINRDFHYHLTPIGGAAPNLHIAQKVINNSFMIAGGTPGLEVSWTVTGVRNDPYMQQRARPVVEDKPEGERGTYQHPELYGQPPEKGMHYRPDEPGSSPSSGASPSSHETLPGGGTQ